MVSRSTSSDSGGLLHTSTCYGLSITILFLQQGALLEMVSEVDLDGNGTLEEAEFIKIIDMKMTADEMFAGPQLHRTASAVLREMKADTPLGRMMRTRSDDGEEDTQRHYLATRVSGKS